MSQPAEEGTIVSQRFVKIINFFRILRFKREFFLKFIQFITNILLLWEVFPNKLLYINLTANRTEWLTVKTDIVLVVVVVVVFISSLKS